MRMSTVTPHRCPRCGQTLTDADGGHDPRTCRGVVRVETITDVVHHAARLKITPDALRFLRRRAA